MADKHPKTSTKTVTEDSLDYVLNFQRHEFKYFIPKHRMENLVPELLHFMKFDDYSGTDYYPLHSIYFDTEDWQAYYEKLDGIERRKKFRIRSYTNNPKPDTKVMLEIKEKNKDVILKRRVPVPFKDIPKFVTGQPILEDNAAHDEWRYALIRNNLRPKILISYERRAFMPVNHGDWRITIDRNVSYAMVKSATDFGANTKPTKWAGKYTVLEVKFDKHPPKFVIDLIRKYNLSNEAISKFTESVISNYSQIL